MAQNTQEKILLNGGSAVQPAVTDIVTTRLASNISPGAFSSDSLIGGTVRAIPSHVFSDSPASQDSPELSTPLLSDDSPNSALRFADAFRIGAVADQGNRKI